MSKPAPRSGPDPKLFKIAGAIAAVVVLVVVAFMAVGSGGSSGSGPIADESGNVFRGQLQSAPRAEPRKKLWSKDCSGECSFLADSSRLYVVSAEDGDSTVTAYSKSGGKEVWHTSVDAGDQLLKIGDTLIVSSDSIDGSSTVALAASDGRERWHKDIAMTYMGENTTLLFSESDQSHTTTHAVDVRSGDERWSHDGYAVATCRGHALLDESSGQSDESGTSGDSYVVYGLANGEKQNSIEVDDDSNGATCSEDGVFVRNGNEIWAYSFTERGRLWETSVSSADGVSAGAGLVFVSRDGRVRALGVSKGDERWNARIAQSNGGFDTYATPMVGGRILLSTNDHELLVKASDGRKIASHDDWPTEQKFCSVGSAITADGSSDTGSSVDTSGAGQSCNQTASSQGTSSQGMLETKGSDVRLVGWSDLEEKWSTDLTDVDPDTGVSDITVGGGQLYVLTDGEIQAYR